MHAPNCKIYLLLSGSSNSLADPNPKLAPILWAPDDCMQDVILPSSDSDVGSENTTVTEVTDSVAGARESDNGTLLDKGQGGPPESIVSGNGAEGTWRVEGVDAKAIISIVSFWRDAILHCQNCSKMAVPLGLSVSDGGKGSSLPDKMNLLVRRWGIEEVWEDWEKDNKVIPPPHVKKESTQTFSGR